MSENGSTIHWEQPRFEDGLDAIAIDLITALVQQIFAEMDPGELVESAGSALTKEQKQAVADMIDHATVELEISFEGDAAGHRHKSH